jgi:phage shock protein C
MTVQPPTPDYSRPQPRRLVRSRNDRMLGGVCAGIADYLRVDVTVVRVLTVVGTVLGFGTLVIAYLVLWVALPQE